MRVAAVVSGGDLGGHCRPLSLQLEHLRLLLQHPDQGLDREVSDDGAQRDLGLRSWCSRGSAGGGFARDWAREVNRDRRPAPSELPGEGQYLVLRQLVDADGRRLEDREGLGGGQVLVAAEERRNLLCDSVCNVLHFVPPVRPLGRERMDGAVDTLSHMSSKLYRIIFVGCGVQ